MSSPIETSFMNVPGCHVLYEGLLETGHDIMNFLIGRHGGVGGSALRLASPEPS